MPIPIPSSGSHFSSHCSVTVSMIREEEQKKNRASESTTHVYTCIHTYTQVHTHALTCHIHTFGHTRVHMHTHAYMHVHPRTHSYTYTHIAHTHVRTHTSACTHTHNQRPQDFFLHLSDWFLHSPVLHYTSIQTKVLLKSPEPSSVTAFPGPKGLCFYIWAVGMRPVVSTQGTLSEAFPIPYHKDSTNLPPTP